MIDDRLDTIDKKLDTISEKLSTLELKLTRKVDRNSLILNGMLWVICALTTAGIAYLYTLVK